MNAEPIAFDDLRTAPSHIAYGSLVDLARLRAGAATAEICEACNTINMGSARYCKGCSHKLPAFYAAMSASESEWKAWQPAAVLPERARLWDLAAFWLVVNSLSLMAAFVPVA